MAEDGSCEVGVVPFLRGASTAHEFGGGLVLLRETEGGCNPTPTGIRITARLVSSTEVNNGSMSLCFKGRCGRGVDRECFELLPVPFL
jgi:hypothetical protein